MNFMDRYVRYVDAWLWRFVKQRMRVSANIAKVGLIAHRKNHEMKQKSYRANLKRKEVSRLIRQVYFHEVFHPFIPMRSIK